MDEKAIKQLKLEDSQEDSQVMYGRVVFLSDPVRCKHFKEPLSLVTHRT